MIGARPKTLGFHGPSGLAGMVLAAGLILVVLIGIASLAYGSPDAALARLRGTSVYTPGYVDFGTGQPGQVVVREISVTNWTDRPVRLIGGTSDCSCVATDSSPQTIDPGQTVEIPVRLKLPRSEERPSASRCSLSAC